MPKTGIQSSLDAELEARVVRHVADEQQQRDDPGHQRERERRRPRVQRDGRIATTMRAEQRQERDDRRGSADGEVHRQFPASSRYEPAITMQPDRDAERVVLDPAGLDAAEPAARTRSSTRPTPLTVPSTTSRSNHHSAVREPAADDDEQQVVELVEPPLVERRAVQEREPGRALISRTALGPGRQIAGRRGRRRTAARRSRCRPPRRRRSRGSARRRCRTAGTRASVVAEQSRRLAAKTGSSHCEIRLAPSGSPRTMPRNDRRDGEQDQRDGHHRRRLVDLVPDRLRAAERAPEGQAHEPEHVERGQAGDERGRSPRPTGSRA